MEGALTAENSIVADNSSETGPNCLKAATSKGNNIENGSSCGFGAAGDQTAEPLLGPLQDNGGPGPTHALLAGSPALDHGAACPATDERGVVRPQGAACDVGAYELAPPGGGDRLGERDQPQRCDAERHGHEPRRGGRHGLLPVGHEHLLRLADARAGARGGRVGGSGCGRSGGHSGRHGDPLPRGCEQPRRHRVRGRSDVQDAAAAPPSHPRSARRASRTRASACPPSPPPSRRRRARGCLWGPPSGSR